jgi:deoxyribodipyrimidine photolyase-related protein
MQQYKKLRLLLGDQLNANHSWFLKPNDDTLFVLMEIRPESEYVRHHIQKLLGFFGAMRDFAENLKEKGFHVRYFRINDEDNLHSFEDNLKALVEKHRIDSFEYQEPDEYRLDSILKSASKNLGINYEMVDSEHFLTSRHEVKEFFGSKSYLMENFYRYMRKKHDVLMDHNQPLGEKWNYDQENRKKFPKDHQIPDPFTLNHDLSDIMQDIEKAGLKHFGNADPKHFIWPLNRQDGLRLLKNFTENLLGDFGPYQDAMGEKSWSNYHSRLSFALNLKMLHPLEVIREVENTLSEKPETNLSSVEGFIRQILGWREYMRGIYWAKMPEYASENFFEFSSPLPKWYWTGDTKMKCLSHSIGQSLDYAYAHHIQRLMITGNFALLMQCDPNEVDSWYLGVYIDAIEWVEITNTRGMSQYADGGLLSSKPYIASANYVNKMSSYCKDCHYDYKKKTGENACPFNSLYWYFLESKREKLESNPRMGMPYRLLNKMDADKKADIMKHAGHVLENRDQL